MIAWKSLFADPTDRTAQANEKLRQLGRRGWITSVVGEAKRIAQTLSGVADDGLRGHTRKLCQFVRREPDTSDANLLALAGGAAYEAIRRTLGLTLFDVQLHAGIIVGCGAVAEMQTGEGKTLSGVLPAYLHALSGHGVHVGTTNEYLAARDYGELKPVFATLGLTVGLIQQDDQPDQKRQAYQADVTFGTGHAFGFDFLRDQLTLQTAEASRLGTQIYQRVCGNDVRSGLIQRPLHAAIVDEIDHVLIDDAVSPLILSSSSQGTAPDAEIHENAQQAAAQLIRDQHYRCSTRRRSVELTDQGFESLYRHHEMAVHPRLLRPWHEYVVLALRAAHCFQRDIHYVVDDDEVQIVDESTGRIFEDRTWSDGLHQAVLALEGLPITPETTSLAKITRQRFCRHYKTLGGMTGTARGCEREFSSVYGMPVCVVPLRTPSKRIIQNTRLCSDQADKFQAIADETKALHDRGRAVLIGTLNIAQSLAVAEQLRCRGLDFQLLNGVQDADEAAIIAAAGKQGAITVATNLAGRGTDIKLDSHVRQLGGLHVVVVEHHALSRVDRQLIGRCARCGDPGSARFYLAADDTLVSDHAPWIARAIARTPNSNTDSQRLSSRVRRVQNEQQSKATSMRWQMLQVDRDNESLLVLDDDLNGCWQL